LYSTVPKSSEFVGLVAGRIPVITSPTTTRRTPKRKKYETKTRKHVLDAPPEVVTTEFIVLDPAATMDETCLSSNSRNLIKAAFLAALIGGLPPAEAFLTKSSYVASTWSFGRFRENALFSSRRPQQRYEDEEDDYYSPITRGRSKEETELRNIPYEDVYYDDDDKDSERPNRNKMQRYRYEDEPEYEEEGSDDYEDDDEEPPAGNFWSNPPRATDPSPRRPRPRSGVYQKRRDGDRLNDDPRRNGRR
jgi:hypothetical protein